MSYCFNPNCPQPDDLLNAGQEICRNCSTELLLQNRYRGVKKLGSGYFAQTIEVEAGNEKKLVKVLLTNYHKAVSLFKREAEVLSLLQHPGIPKVEPEGYFSFEIKGTPEPVHCLLMEKIEGCNLEEWLAKRGEQPISEEQAIDWLKQLVEILALLHEQQYLHRDIKPSNIMLKPNGQLVLIDFGAVREITGTYLIKISGEKDATRIGTAGYTPAEQADGKAIFQSDFFALGRTFVHLLTGIHPFDIPLDPKTGLLLWRDKAPEVSQKFAHLIDWLIAPFPGNRPVNAQEILQYLKTVKTAFKEDILIPQASDKQDMQRQSFKFIPMAVAGLMLVISWPFISQHLANVINDRGVEDYNQNRPIEGLEKVIKALAINPNSIAANYNKGRYCEELKDYKCALEKYKDTAINGELAAAYSSWARLQIFLAKDYAGAAEIIDQGLRFVNNEKVKQSLVKNKGWAMLGLKNYPEAKKLLENAIEIDKETASPYCLLAEVLEAEKDRKNSLKNWEKCRQYADIKKPEENVWLEKANQRLGRVY